MDRSQSRIEAQDSLILFADLQEGIVELTRTNPLDRLTKGVGGLAKLAKLMNIPAIVTGVRSEAGAEANVIPQIADGLGKLPTYHRTTCDSFCNAEIVSAIEAMRRKTLLIAGVATEVAVQLAALTAADQGYGVYVVLDACGGISERTEQAALMRMTKAGVSAVSVIALAGELAGDFREPEAAPAVAILYEMAIS